MDFFAEQDSARKRTRRLVALFVLAVIAIVAIMYAIWVGIFYMSMPNEVILQAAGEDTRITLWNPQIFAWSTGITVAVIALGTLYKISKLARGGEAVALALGGRRVDPGTTSFEERRLLNVVEEMSIAAGVPVPDVFILENEPGINAFAAGFTTSDAVIGVTQGTAQLLSRSELQGVIAHEFSHILHGDMKINLRAIGLLFGIFLIAVAGRWIIEASLRSRDRAFAAVFAGIAVFIVGSIGLFFGRLIQAAISRQREVLADASAVQFTRDPSGLAGALKKIGGLSNHSFMQTPAAEEASHMFFGEAIKRLALFEGLMRTHPKLGDRIRKLEPHWDGAFGTVELPAIGEPDRVGAVSESAAALGDRAIATLAPAAIEGAFSHIGDPSPQEVASAQTLRAALPEVLVDASRQPHSAQALVFGLLLAPQPNLRTAQVAALRQQTDARTADLALRAHGASAHRASAEKIALVDMAIPVLRHLSRPEYERFVTVVGYLMRSDQDIDLFEYALSRIIVRHLGRRFDGAGDTPVKFRRLKSLVGDATVVLSALAHCGSGGEAGVRQAFAAGVEALGIRGAGISLLPPQACGLQRVDQALKRYDASTPQLKKSLMHACASVVMNDTQIDDREAELLRAIADTIDVPIPPFLRA